jgi:hypothetical protein
LNRAFWIWQIKETEGGDPLAIAAAAHRAGLTDVFVKVADGVYRYNTSNGKDLVPATVQALRAVGVRVWGWQYCYGAQPEAEEAVATARIKELNLDGYIVDAEVEFKKPGYDKNAERYLSLLRQHNPNVKIAFSSYRFPHYHPEFPWAVFYKYCDINMPQVYWLQAHNAAQQTETCFQKFQAMGKLPIIPAGPAWKENGWRPTPQEIRDFEAVAAKHGAAAEAALPTVSYWDWQQCRRDCPELWPADVITPPPPPATLPTPTTPPENDRLTRLEQKIQDLEKTLADLSKVLVDLKAILK